MRAKMSRLAVGTGALVGALLTAPLIALMYLGKELAGLPFVPFDLFDWATRVLPGWLVTFGIDLMIDTMLLVGISVPDAAKAAERVISIVQLLVIGVAVGVVFFALLRLRRSRPGPAGRPRSGSRPGSAPDSHQHSHRGV